MWRKGGHALILLTIGAPVCNIHIYILQKHTTEFGHTINLVSVSLSEPLKNDLLSRMIFLSGIYIKSKIKLNISTISMLVIKSHYKLHKNVDYEWNFIWKINIHRMDDKLKKI